MPPETTKKPASWVRVFKPRPNAKLRLFCFAYAGGGPSVFRPWSDGLPLDVEVVAVQLPGRESRWREPARKQMAELADELTEHLLAEFDRPFVFFGHSMGAILSFEVTRRLVARKAVLPERLIVSGRRAPTIPDEDEPTYNLPREEFIEEIRGLTGTPDEVLEHQELMELMLPVLRADFEACDTYSFDGGESRLPVPLIALGGVEDERIPPDSIDLWGQQTSGEFSSRMFPGGHFFLNDHRSELLDFLKLHLSKVQVGVGSGVDSDDLVSSLRKGDLQSGSSSLVR